MDPLPAGVVALRDLIADGAIGEVRSVQADLGVGREYDPTDRLFDLALGGGALLDLGVYVVSFAQMLLGTPERVVAAGSLFPSGADAEAVAAARLRRRADGDADDVAAQRAARARPASSGRRAGSTSSPASTTRRRSCCTAAGAEPETITRPPLGAGYAHELIEVDRVPARRDAPRAR